MTTWEDCARSIESKLRDSINYAQITVIQSGAEYILGNVAQALNQLDYLIVISRPEEGHYYTEPMLAGYFRRHYVFDLICVVKTDPGGVNRIMGNARMGLSEFQSVVEQVLEHSNMNSSFDNKAGQNFEDGWSIIPLEGRAFSASRTLYTAVKTER